MARRGKHAETRRQRRARLRRERRAAVTVPAGVDAAEEEEDAPGSDDEVHEGHVDEHVEPALDDAVELPDDSVEDFASPDTSTQVSTDEPDVVSSGDELGEAAAEPAPARAWSGPATPLRRRSGVAAALLVGLVMALGAGSATYLLLDGSGAAESAARAPEALAAGLDQSTLLVVRRDGEGAPAEGLTLLVTGPQEESGLVLFLPVGTLVDIPGVGLDRLSLTHQYGGPVLTQAAVENLLGIEIDHVATINEPGLSSLLARTGGLDVAVPSRLIERADDGTAEVRFEAGQHQLDGRRLAEYWGFVSRGEDELASFSRQQAVLRGLLEHIRDPGAFDVVFGDGAPQLDATGDAEWVRGLMAELASAHEQNQLRVTMLPVESFGGDGPDGGATFRPRREELATLVAETLAASVPTDGVGGAVRVQVLNGVGVPGIGQVVDRRLGGGSFRIVLTDNARSFDFTETRILVYDESPRSMEAGRRVQERLGVGTIQVSRQPQSVVDVTIVVGSDFLEAEGIAPVVEDDQTDDDQTDDASTEQPSP